MTYSSTKVYDFIFLGTGCAALSILVRMIDSGKFADKRFLLVNKGPKTNNDRTWCFWEKETGYFETLVYKKWDDLIFKSDKLSLSLEIAPYQYKMIRGLDFYNYCFSKIHLQNNIEIKYGDISFDDLGNNGGIKINGELLQVDNATVFNSIYRAAKKRPHEFYLLQHFKGWIIETSKDQFNARQGILMDFSVPQISGTAFVYLLPLNANRALIEYTLFTENLLEQQEYERALQSYVEQHLNITNFKIVEKEFGVIPMTNIRFAGYENKMYNIGTAGGQTKASTGYTFQFIQKHATQVVQNIIAKKYPAKKANRKNRFHFYDSTLLHILAGNKLTAKEIFTKLFQKNKAGEVFKFLDNETNIHEELKIISSLPKKQFLAAGIKEFIKMI